MEVPIFYHKNLKEYNFGIEHPFQGERFEVFIKFLKAKIGDNLKILEAEPATKDDLLLICKKDYIDFVEKYYKNCSEGKIFDERAFNFLSPDNIPSSKSGNVALANKVIIGQVKNGCDLILEDKYRKIVVLGGGLHHAKPSFGEGFCVFNDVAFAAKYLIEKYNLKRILILDTDAHAGNGTKEYFYRDNRVLFIDVHQDPRTLYPGTGFIEEIGEGEGKGFTLNIPLPPYSGRDSYDIVFKEIIEPVVYKFKPQIIIRNGGSDPHFSDRLTQLGLCLSDFLMIGREVRKMAEICSGKVIDLIASGYNEQVLPYAWFALIAGLFDLKVDIEEPIVMPPQFKNNSGLGETKRIIKKIKDIFKDYWKCFS